LEPLPDDENLFQVAALPDEVYFVNGRALPEDEYLVNGVADPEVVRLPNSAVTFLSGEVLNCGKLLNFGATGTEKTAGAGASTWLLEFREPGDDPRYCLRLENSLVIFPLASAGETVATINTARIKPVIRNLAVE
jgi:hypothetical protein